MEWELFLGEYRHSLDNKGRVILPSKFRDRLESCVVTKSEDRCLALYDAVGWEQFTEQVRSLPKMDRRVRLYARAAFGQAHEDSPDKQGRITIPQHLREYAGLDRDVVIAGMDDRIEIWDASEWQRVSREADGAFSEIAETLAHQINGSVGAEN